jgi:hypothetical protein
MTDNSLANALLVTPLHRAVYKILLDAGFKDGKVEGGKEIEGPPVVMASMVTMTLSAYPTEDQLVDAMTWGNRDHWDEIRPIARQLLALIESGRAPA